MIAANELRIGNWVTYLGELYQVNGIRNQKDVLGKEYVRVWIAIDELQTSKTIDWLKPVPLTEEWMHKFGLRNHGYEFLHWSIGAFTIAGDGVDFGRCYDHDFSPPGLNVDLKYVHQLQNLYFALTGEELTLKTPAKLT